MKSLGEFVPLSLLIPSLENSRRLYFFYRQAAETGSPGANARFRWFKQRLPDKDLVQMERLFGIPPRTRRAA